MVRRPSNGNRSIQTLLWTLGTLASAAGAFVACGDASPVRSVSARTTSELVRAPVVSNAIDLATPRLGPHFQTNLASVAAGPDGSYLMVYERQVGGFREIYGTRVLSNGTIPDPEGVTLDRFEHQEVGSYNVLAKYTTDHFLLVHQRGAITVAANGRPTSRRPLALENATSLQRMQWGDDRALAVTTSGHGLMFDESGAPIGNPLVLTEPQPYGGITSAGVGFDGSHFLTAFAFAPSKVVVSSVGASGPTGHSAVVSTSVRPSSSASVGPVASNGNGFMMTYSADCVASCGPEHLHRRSVTVGATGEISLGAEMQADGAFVTVANGNYVNWFPGATARTLDASGTAGGDLTPEFTAISNAFGPGGSWFELEPARAGGGFLAFSAHVATRLDANFARLDDPLLTTLLAPADQTQPAVAFDSENFVVTWIDSARNALVLARVSPEGTVLDAEPIVVESGAMYGHQVASNGTSALVAWGGYPSTALAGAARLLPNGDKVPVVVPSGDFSSFSVASGGSDYMFVWKTYTSPKVYAAISRPDGTLTNPIELEQASGEPKVTFDGEHYVVTWTQDVAWTDLGTETALRAVRVGRDLTRVDSPPKTLKTFAANQSSPVLAANPEGWLTAWLENAADGTKSVRSSRLTRNLELVPRSEAVVSATNDGYGLKAAWDGSAYWVVWPNSLAPGASSLVGRRLTANGTFLDAQPFEIARDQAVFNVKLSVQRPGELLVVYERGMKSKSVVARRLSAQPSDDGGAAGAGGESGAGASHGGNATGGSATGGSPTGGTSGGNSTGGSAEGGEPGNRGGSAGENTGGTTGQAGSTSGGGTAGDSASAGGEELLLDGDEGGCECAFSRGEREKYPWTFAVFAGVWALSRRRLRARPHSGR